MKTFKDLNFNIPPLMHKSRATIYFDDGYGVSVNEDRFSLARTPNIWSVHIIKNGVIGCDTPEIKEIEESGDMGYVSKERVTEIMKAVQELGDSDKWVKVSELLPKNTKPVLVKGNTPSGRETIQVGRLYKSGWVTDTYFKVDVKEWKPIE